MPNTEDNGLSDALNIIAHIVSQATVNPVIAEDKSGEFISRYDMPVGSIHKAIPFLARHGIIVDKYGAILGSKPVNPASGAIEYAIRKPLEDWYYTQDSLTTLVEEKAALEAQGLFDRTYWWRTPDGDWFPIGDDLWLTLDPPAYSTLNEGTK